MNGVQRTAEKKVQIATAVLVGPMKNFILNVETKDTLETMTLFVSVGNE